MICPLCQQAPCLHFARIDGKDYFRCPHCQLTLLDPQHWPDPDSERAYYQLHRNDPNDPRYRNWLARLEQPLAGYLAEPAEGLDFGCGPGPALARMLSERGHRLSLYDPLYANDPSALQRDYDFITCTEVVEHFHHPAEMFALLATLLRPGGWLGIMTGLLHDHIDFARWHYRRDPTHVCFYRPHTFRIIGMLNGMTPVSMTETGVIILQKSSADETY